VSDLVLGAPSSRFLQGWGFSLRPSFPVTQNLNPHPLKNHKGWGTRRTSRPLVLFTYETCHTRLRPSVPVAQNLNNHPLKTHKGWATRASPLARLYPIWESILLA
jgi:hypothetical protein